MKKGKGTKREVEPRMGVKISPALAGEIARVVEDHCAFEPDEELRARLLRAADTLKLSLKVLSWASICNKARRPLRPILG